MSSIPTSAEVILSARDVVLRRPGSPGEAPFRLKVDAIEILRGEVLALCGPSGSGKSTLLSILAGLLRPDSGRVQASTDAGPVDLYGEPPAAWRRRRRDFGFVYQDPRDSLNDRRRVVDIVADPLSIQRLPGLPAGLSAGRARKARALDLLARAGITPDQAGRSPSALSGGQRQRVALARALITGPRLVFLDEPTSALDVSVQASIVEMLRAMHRDEPSTSYLLVTHDLALARQLADRLAVLNRGEVVECGDLTPIFRSPASPVTARLLGLASESPDP